MTNCNLELFFNLGSLICKDVKQTPPDVLCLPEKNVTLTCSHSFSSHDTILWYQKTQGDTSLKLIGYVRYTSIKEIEKDFQGHFTVTGDGQTSASLQIPKARQVPHSALYFCAAYYTVLHMSSPINKNLPLISSTPV